MHRNRTALQTATLLVGHITKGTHKGFEPFPQAPQACMPPLHQCGHKAVQPGFEPESPGRQPGMLAINTTVPCDLK